MVDVALLKLVAELDDEVVVVVAAAIEAVITKLPQLISLKRSNTCWRVLIVCPSSLASRPAVNNTIHGCLVPHVLVHKRRATNREGRTRLAKKAFSDGFVLVFYKSVPCAGLASAGPSTGVQTTQTCEKGLS
jgi:hypothetical protein